jgi:hypothetical protein
MNRSLEGWKTWYTEPLTNIGVFFVRGNKKTVKLFDSAWKDYLVTSKYCRLQIQPGLSHLICFITEYR